MKLTKHTRRASELKPGDWMIPRGEEYPRVIGKVDGAEPVEVADGTFNSKTRIRFDFYRGMKNHLYGHDEQVTFYKARIPS